MFSCRPSSCSGAPAPAGSRTPPSWPTSAAVPSAGCRPTWWWSSSCASTPVPGWASAPWSCSGAATAQWWGLRQLSLSIARVLDGGGAPAVQAALVKEMGTRFEQDVLAAVQQLVDLEPSAESDSLFERPAGRRRPLGPVFHPARRNQRDPALRRRQGAEDVSDPVLLQSAERVLIDVCTHESIQSAEEKGWDPEIWEALGGSRTALVGPGRTGRRRRRKSRRRAGGAAPRRPPRRARAPGRDGPAGGLAGLGRGACRSAPDRRSRPP